MTMPKRHSAPMLVTNRPDEMDLDDETTRLRPEKEDKRNGDTAGRRTTVTEQLTQVAKTLQIIRDQEEGGARLNRRVLCWLRGINITLLILVVILLLSGATFVGRDNERHSYLFLTVDKWHSSIPPVPGIETQMNLELQGQYFVLVALIIILTNSIIITTRSVILGKPPGKLWQFVTGFASVPVFLVVFGFELHYSACPWLKPQTTLKEAEMQVLSRVHVTESGCRAFGWAAAGILSLIVGTLFAIEGFYGCFTEREDSTDKRNYSWI